VSQKVCVIPADFTLADYQAHPCQEGRHAHLSRAQLRPYIEQKRVVILQGSLGHGRRELARIKGEKTVIWILPCTKDAVTGRTALAGLLNSGLSFQFGEYLAMRVRQRESWALAMVAEMRGRRMPENSENPDCG
jgi:hypothetical protein